MNPDWQNFLAQQGATSSPDFTQHFGDPAAELESTAHGTIVCAPGQFSTLRASGAEAQTFLQNLLSNDIRELDGSRAQWSSFNSAKGRMLATFLIWRDGEDYLLQLPAALAGAMQKKLGMYVLRAKVKISDTDNEVISLGISGPDARALLQQHGLVIPEQTMGVTADARASLIRLGDNRFQLNTTPAHAPGLWQTLALQAKPAGSPCWDWLNIRAGIPVILPQTQEQFVPQMANLDLIGGINFKKGCYPGQEIVARMHYLGKLKRRMYLAHVASEASPQPGDEVFSADMGEQASGMIANSAAAPGGGYDVLAVVQTASQETSTLHLASPHGPALTLLPLPYPLP
ncbi:MAG: folate-binding protein [Gallionella sp.]|nr:folate-binding protein [Gallionella sp.]MDD4945799.1 folate-binding protein [Gallionella sp.]